MSYKQRPSRVFYDDKLKKYYVTQIAPSIVNGQAKGKKLVRAYIKDIPQSILKGAPSQAIHAVQKWVSDKYAGKLTLPESKIDDSERLMYYKFPTYRPTSYQNTDKLQEKIAKESKETVAQQRIKQAMEYVKDPVKFGVADFTDAEITQAKKLIEDQKQVAANTLAQNLMATEVAKREAAEAKKVEAENARLAAETELKKLDDLKNKTDRWLRTIKLNISAAPAGALGSMDDLKVVHDLAAGLAKTYKVLDDKLKKDVTLEGIIWSRGAKGAKVLMPDANTVQKAAVKLLGLPLDQIKDLNNRLGFTGIVGYGDGKAPSKLPPLWDDQIDDFFDKEPHFAGTIAIDEIKDLPNKIPMGFIMNTLPRDAPESETGHWVATYISGDSVEYYDPLGDAPDKEYMIGIKKKIEDMRLPILMKFKVNAVKDQHGNSQHCGYHCIRFLDDRFHGIPYAMTTRYDVDRDGKIDDSKNGEKKIAEQFKLI